jgi:hypothetical protein
MAVLIPETPKDCPHGERIVFERLARDLDDDWVVLHSLGLVKHQKKLWGEADFILLTTKGVFAIEVKGGRISCRNGAWIHEAPGREPYTRKESPWTQANTCMQAVMDALFESDRDLKGLLFGYGVIMPHEHFRTTGPEIELETLLNADNFGRNLRFYIGDLMRYWTEAARNRQETVRRLPTREEIRRMRAILRPDFDSTFSLGSYFNGLEKEQLLLTNGQIRAARGVANNPRTVIRGRAGTGKTVIALDHARRLAQAGHDVLYLCFNQLLARHVEQSLKDDQVASRIRVRHIHSLFREVINRAGLSGRLDASRTNDADFFGHVFPELFVEASFMVEPPAADVLVIDEAQDLLTMANIDALDVLLKEGLRKGRWHMFLDPMQNIYGKESEEAERVLRVAGFAEYDLFENCRNTRQVAIQTSIVSGIDMAIDGAPEGPEGDCTYYRDRDDFLGKLDSCLRKLFAGDVSADQIIILSTRRLENSLLAGCETVAGLPLKSLNDGPVSDGLLFATMHAFKGLERNVVIAIDVDNVGDEAASMLHYAGLSRARGLLCIFMPDDQRKAYQAQAQSFGVRLATGSMS